MSNYLKLSVINNLSTGNIFFDIIISLLILFIVGDGSYNRNFDKINNIIQKFFFKNNDNYELSLFCEEVKNYRGTRLKGSFTFKAVLVHIRNKISKNEVIGLKKIKEYYNEKDYDEFNLHDNDPIIFMSNQNDNFELIGKDEPNILFKIESTELDCQTEDKKIKTKIYELKLIGNPNINLKSLQDYVEAKTESYHKYLDTHDENIYVFNYNGIDCDGRTIFKQNIFQSTCNMDNLYFDKKDELIEKILFFENNKNWYETKSKPYTLGICTHGLPGCGKTSFEKALAKMLDRHLIIVDISKFKSNCETDSVFFSEKINDRIIPYNKRIYIFPDFDCQSNITNERTSETKQYCENKKDNFIIINNNDQNIIDNLIDKKDKSNEMNLSKLLNILDGIPERTGQIMIFNTNHPEHLDNALLRPGRMDVIFKFDKLSTENSVKMIYNYYNITIPKLDLNLKIPNKEYTPAELFNILGNYKNIDDAINDISNWKNKLNLFS